VNESLSARIGGLCLIVFALSMLSLEIVLHTYATLNQRSYDLNHMVILMALILGFVGMYVLSPSKAKDGGRFIVDSTVKIVQVIRFGRRKNDAVMTTIEDREGHRASLVTPTITTETELPVEPMADMQRRKTDEHEGGDDGT
jgi:hypothetical protein